jgi:thymidylate synthase (FAD)
MKKVLDHGYIRYVESWGHGDSGNAEAEDGRPISFDDVDDECGIIEAARQSTQGSFRGWDDKVCPICHGDKVSRKGDPSEPGARLTDLLPCDECEGKGYLPGDQRLLAYLFNGKPQHATPFEFAGMVIEVQAPILVFREWHRHRTQSYNEMSARYAPLPDLNYVPTVERLLMNQGTKNKQAGAVKGSDDITHESALEWLEDVSRLYRYAEDIYQDGLARGVPKEVARVVVPVGRYSRMRAQANLRNWLAFMTLRADPAAQWEIRQYAEAMGEILQEHFPRTYSLFLKGRSV